MSGNKADELLKSGNVANAAAFLQGLSGIRWGRDRGLSEATVSKCLTIYTRVKECPGAIELIQQGHA